MVELIVIGDSDPPVERSVIRDEFGDVYVDVGYPFQYPEWYSYIGHCRINGDIVHYFNL